MSNAFTDALNKVLSLELDRMGEFVPRTVAEAIAFQLVRDSLINEELQRTIVQIALRLPSTKGIEVNIEHKESDHGRD